MGDVAWLEITLRTTGVFAVLLIMTRFLGKKQMSQLTFFNYITGVTIGNIAGDIASQKAVPYFNGLLSIVWWSLLAIAVGYLSLRSVKVRVVVDGQPTVIIKHGRLSEEAMKRTRLNLDDLSMLLREHGVFKITGVDYAVLEPNGQLSVLKKPELETPTKQDLAIPSLKSQYMPSEIICDGKVVERNLRELGLSRQWLSKKLSGVAPEKVYYAELQPDGSLYYQLKESKRGGADETK